MFSCLRGSRSETVLFTFVLSKRLNHGKRIEERRKRIVQSVYPHSVGLYILATGPPSLCSGDRIPVGPTGPTLDGAVVERCVRDSGSPRGFVGHVTSLPPSPGGLCPFVSDWPHSVSGWSTSLRLFLATLRL